MSYCPKIKKDLLTKLYFYKHSLEKRRPITQLVNEAVQEYLEKRTEQPSGSKSNKLKERE